MSKLESRTARWLSLWVGLFLLSIVSIYLAVSPIPPLSSDARLWCLVLGIFGMGASVVGAIITMAAATAIRSAAISKARTGPRVKRAVMIHSVWRTEKGRIIAPHEEATQKPGYHAVLVTEDGQRIEVETDPAVFAGCIEGSWGYAELQGDWLGSYRPDPELYTKHTGR